MSVYLDANSGIPYSLTQFEELSSYLKKDFFFQPNFSIANASSIHHYGRKARKAMETARESIGISLGLKKNFNQLIFTSSGTEANQLAVRSLLEPKLQDLKKPHWITSAIEHDSNRQMIDWVRKRGGRVSELPVDGDGQICFQSLKDLICPETALVSLIWVNNETGVISDLKAMSAITRLHAVPLHIDAAQAWGKIPFSLEELGVELASFSGAKIGSFGGVGVLWSGMRFPIAGCILGKQEKLRRGGTENLMGILSLGLASKKMNPFNWSQRVAPVRDFLEQKMIEKIPSLCINGKNAIRIANTSNVSFAKISGESLVIALDLAGYAVSAGAACASGSVDPSHVLLAMGRTKEEATSSLRISLIDDAIPMEVLEGFVHTLSTLVKRIQKKCI